MTINDLKDILCRDHGLVSVESESLDEFLALACEPQDIVQAYGDKRVVDIYADFNPLYGPSLVIRIA